MKIIFAIPHFYRRVEKGAIGSTTSSPEQRAAYLGRCVTSLRQTFGTGQGLVDSGGPPRRSNGALAAEVHIVLCTSGPDHLAASLPPGLVQRFESKGPPAELGFACHRILRSVLGRFDYYCFLEDDIEITDALFFRKLAWFSQCFGNDALLQPNRFERSAAGPLFKLYLDGNTRDPDLSLPYQDIAVRPKLSASGFGGEWLFQRVRNPHCGGFFLNQEQMAVLAKKGDFGRYTAEFISPLESAATLPVMRHFRVYKPARENAAFLELRHLGQRFLRPRPAS
ncbi:MAG TPA: hypothetical protein VFA23_15705 [Dongiaceae bacterium]|nr:hypothetical protein [Dongiaceae bacterium]